MRLSPTFSDCAESALLVDFGLHYDRPLSLSILQVSTRLQALMLPGLKEIIPALSSLTVLYDPLELSKERIVHEIRHLCEVSSEVPDCSRTWEVPVVYGGEGGPDLEEVALRAGITEEETVALHAGRDYFVYIFCFFFFFFFFLLNLFVHDPAVNRTPILPLMLKTDFENRAPRDLGAVYFAYSGPGKAVSERSPGLLLHR